MAVVAVKWHRQIRVAGYESRYERECREADEWSAGFLRVRDTGDNAMITFSEPITMTCNYGPVSKAPHVVMEFDDVVYHFYPTLEDE